MRRYALRDGREGHVGVTAKDNRLFVEAVIYRYHLAQLMTGPSCWK
jgi:hypothetical protein